MATLARSPRFPLLDAAVRDAAGLELAGIDAVVHLAACTGVRPSVQDPLHCTRVNVEGTIVMLELARGPGVKAFACGPSSSVYGDSTAVPFREDAPAVAPISPYAATKRAGELLCHTYAHLHGLSVVCLRFFTVYGPRQRPDLAIHNFARLMAAGEPVRVFGDGSTRRDYTCVDDIVQGVEGAIGYAAAHPGAFELFNLGESDTVPLSRLVELLGAALGVVPVLHRLPAQPGDVRQTLADLSRPRHAGLLAARAYRGGNLPLRRVVSRRQPVVLPPCPLNPRGTWPPRHSCCARGRCGCWRTARRESRPPRRRARGTCSCARSAAPSPCAPRRSRPTRGRS